MEAKRIEMYALLRASFTKTEISKQLNISKMYVHLVEQRFKASGFLKDYRQAGRPQVIS